MHSSNKRALVVAGAIRWVALVLVGTLWLAAASAQTLTIGRQDLEQPLIDISEAVIREAFRRAGLTPNFRRLSLPRVIEAADTGETDGDMHRIAGIADKYSNLVTVPTPINRVEVGVYGVASDLPNRSRAEIGKMKIVIQRGIFVLAKYTRDMSVTDTQTSATAFEMLRNGRVDVAMLPRIDAEFWIRKDGIQGIVRWPYAWASEPLYLLLNRKHVALVKQIDEALVQMQREGLIDKYYADTLRKYDIRPLKTERP